MAETTITGNAPDSISDGASELDIINEPVKGFDKEIPDGSDDDSGDEDEHSEDEGESEEEDEATSDESEDDTDDESGEDSEDEESGEEDEEALDPVAKNLYNKLKSESPELFKKHPELRSVIFREQQYTEMFPSVAEAKEVKEKYDAFSELEASILDGSPEMLLASIEGTDKKAFEDFAHNLLPTILKQSKEVYSSMLELPLKRAIQQAYVDARKSGNENLMNSALYVDQFFFGTDGIGKDPESASKRKDAKQEKKSPEVERLEQERNEHAERIKGEFNTSVIETIQFKIRKEISSVLDKYEFDTYKRKNVSRDIENEVNNILSSDKRYQASVRSLYNQASQAKFSSDWKSRISSAYLARARAVLPLAKKKVIADATGRSISNDGLKVKRRLTPTNLSTRAPQKLDVNKIDKSRTTEMDILSGDESRIKYKGQK